MMRTRMILMGILMAMLLTVSAASAEEYLAANYTDGILEISWEVQENCVLTIYRNGWPLSVSSVEEAGEIRKHVGVQPGEYSVRLKTETGCLTAIAKPGGQEAEKPEAPQSPETTATPAITAEPTVKPNVTPVPTATMAPTKAPTITAAPVASYAPGMSGQSLTSLAAQVISEVNAERAKAGLAPLSMSPELTGAACLRAREIVEKFSHTRPDGSSWSTVSSGAYGENIAKGHNSPQRVMAAWMTSDGHRANILKESFGSIGVCAWKVDGVIYWVQLFGK